MSMSTEDKTFRRAVEKRIRRKQSEQTRQASHQSVVLTINPNGLTTI